MNQGKRLLRTYAATQFFQWFSLGLVIPVTVLFQQDRGFSLSQIALVMASFSAVSLILELPTGGLADAVGRKRIYLVSRILAVVSRLCLLFAWTFPVMLLGWMIYGVSRSLSSGSLDAWFVDEFRKQAPEGDLQKALSRVNIVVLFSLAAGNLAGGALPDLLTSLGWGKTVFGLYLGNLAVSLAVAVLGTLYTALQVKEERPEVSGALAAGFRSVPSILGTAARFGFRHRSIFLILLTGLAWGFGFSGLEQLWQPRLKEILSPGAGTWIFGVVSAGYFFSGILGNSLAPALCRLFRQDYRKVLFLSRLVMGGFFFLLLSQQGPGGFMVFYFLLFTQNGIANSPGDTLFHNLIPGETRSTLLSLSSLFLQGGGMAGTLAAGFLADRWSVPLAWIPSAGVLALSSFLFLMVEKPEEPEGETADETPA